MPKYIIKPAVPEDKEGLLKLFRIPMPGRISLAMEREPDYFSSASVQAEEPEIYVCHETESGKVAGCFSVGMRKVYFNKYPTPIRYFSDLRILPEFQGATLLFRMIRFLRQFKVMEKNEIAQTIIFADNATMVGLIDKADEELSKKLSLPRYNFYGGYTTNTVFFASKKREYQSDYTVRPATTADIPKMQALHDQWAPYKQFYPVYDFSQLDHPYYKGMKIEDFYLAFQGDELMGMTGIWDQKPFKQTRVFAYTAALRYFRPLVNMVGKLDNNFQLPPAGSLLNYFSLHSIVTAENDPAVFQALVEHIYAQFQESDYDYFLCGLDERDPLSNVFDSFKAKRAIEGNFYLVTLEQGDIGPITSFPYYIEAARI